MGLWEIEDSLYAKGCAAVCGIDEAGRGPLAGPVCAAACILPQDLQIEGLNDSKKLSAKKREALYDIITEQAIAWAVCLIDEATRSTFGRPPSRPCAAQSGSSPSFRITAWWTATATPVSDSRR